MFRSSRGGLTAAVLIGALALAGCASMRVNSFVERGANLASYRTFAWAPEESFSTGDPRLDNNPFFRDRLRSSVDRELAARKYEKSASGTPDLIVHFHASVSQEINLSGTADQYGRCDGCTASVYDAGTLVLDLVDSSTQKLVWRGWAEGVNAVIDKQDWMEQTIDDAVARILKRLPPRM